MDFREDGSVKFPSLCNSGALIRKFTPPWPPAGQWHLPYYQCPQKKSKKERETVMTGLLLPLLGSVPSARHLTNHIFGACGPRETDVEGHWLLERRAVTKNI